MKYKVFIDGREGTTGLQIDSRMQKRGDVELLVIDEKYRKDAAARKELLNEADVAFLCLPDDAARESVSLVENDRTVVIDTSTAHRTDADWTYGLPELSAAQRKAIARSKRIANPGCHATGFIVLAYPLLKSGIIAPTAELSCVSVTGYSGGGKKMIAQYEAADRPAEFSAPRMYALTQAHKHIPEMTAVTGLEKKPVFLPLVCDYYSGMSVTLTLTEGMLRKGSSVKEVFEAVSAFYAGQKFISVFDAHEGMISGVEMAEKPGLNIYVLGDEGRITLTSVFDNLCKGASGAAVQNMNIALGIDEAYSLI